MRMLDKKSQGALEFLTTYGWVFIVILIIVGVLAYMGVLRPSKLLPERCNFGDVLKCEAFEVTYSDQSTSDGTVKFQLRNNVGTDIIVDSISASTETVEPYDCTPDTIGLSDLWTDRSTKNFNFTDCNSTNAQFSKGKKGKVLVDVAYHKIGASAFQHTVNGEIYATLR